MSGDTLVVWTCKRCKSKTETEPEIDGGVVVSVFPKGWQFIDEDLLCNDCMCVFRRLKTQFLKRMLP